MQDIRISELGFFLHCNLTSVEVFIYFQKLAELQQNKQNQKKHPGGKLRLSFVESPPLLQLLPLLPITIHIIQRHPSQNHVFDSEIQPD